MGIEKEREAFETWCHIDDQFCTHRYAGSEDYSDDYAQCAWLAWQAAKAQSVMEPSIDLNGHDIKRITHFMCYEDPENLDTEVTIQVCNSGFSGAGLYAWVAEYPGEGGIKLSESPQEQTQ